MEEINALKRKRMALLDKARDLIDGDDETDHADRLISQADELEVRINELEGNWRAQTRTGIVQREGVYASRGPKTGPMHIERNYDMSNDNKFSIVRAIRAMVNNDWRGAEAEREASDRAAKELGRESRGGGVLIPDDVWLPSRAEQRDLLKGTASAGGYMVASDVLGERFIDRLVNKSVMLSAGVQTMDNLVGDVVIPRLATGPTAYWVAENSAITEGSETFEQLTLSPKTVGAYIDISRRLLQQASLDVENMVRNDILRSLGTAIDLAILQGTGTNQPTGVVNTTGVTDCSGTNGDDMTLAEVIELETTVAEANADTGRLAYITNPHMRGVLKQTLITATYGEKFVWGEGATPLNGYAAYVTGQIPANLAKAGGSNLSYVFFGDWSSVILGRWSGLDVLVDPYTGGTAGTVRVLAFADVDVAMRHPASVVFGYYS